MPHYLITGGCGFIGSHLVDGLLARGHRVRVLDDLSTGTRENLPAAAELVVGSVTDLHAVMSAMRGVDGCFHLAAISSVERTLNAPSEARRINFGGMTHVIEAATSAPPDRPTIPVVYASSAAVYGDNPDVPLTERAVPAPISAYGTDKLDCERAAQASAEGSGLSVTGLRFFNVYGPRQDPASPYSGVISIFLQRLIEGLPLTIYGDGLQTRDFVYVGDAVRAAIGAMDALQAARGATRRGMSAARYNVCTGRPTTIRDLGGILGALCEVTPRFVFAPARRNDIRTSVGDGQLLAASLGVRIETTLSVGLSLTFDAVSGRRATSGNLR